MIRPGTTEIENKTVLTDLLYQPVFQREYDFVHYDSPDRRGIDVALLYRRKAFSVRSHENIRKDEFYNLAFIPYSKRVGTVFAKGRWLLFDQIMISRGMMTGKGARITASRLTIHFDKRLLFYDQKRSMYRPNRSYSGKKYHGGFSDHLPVYVAMDPH
jgi:hypothetical protein